MKGKYATLAGLELCVPHSNQKHAHDFKCATSNSSPWNKTGDFGTPILCPDMDKNKIKAA